MLTKSDLKAIDKLLDKRFNTELKPVKQDIASVKQDLTSVKQDIASVKNDTKSMKKNLKDLTDFVKGTIPPIFEWIDEIHRTIVKEKLPQRVKKLEHTLKTS